MPQTGATIRPFAAFRSSALFRLSLELIAIIILTYPLWGPLFNSPGLPDTHDSRFHLARVVELEVGLRAGVVYPRLAPDLALGYDYPVGNYYAPLTGYLALLFKALGLGLIGGIKAVYALSFVLGGLGMLHLAREHYSELPAWGAAISYALLPYLALDVYTRGALAESLGLALLPLCLLAFRKLAQTPSRQRIVAGAFVVGLLLLTHNITSLIGLPFVGVYYLFSLYEASHVRGLAPPPIVEAPADDEGSDNPFGLQLDKKTVKKVETERDRVVKSLGRSALAALLGAGIGAIYWAPAFFERDFVAEGKLTSSFFDFHNHFISVGRLIQAGFAFDYSYDFLNNVLFTAGLLQILMAVAGLLLYLIYPRTRTFGALFGLTLLFSLFLQTRLSTPLWESLPILAYVQFPWRFLALTGLASAMLTGALLTLPASLPRRAERWALSVLLLIGVYGGSLYAARAELTPRFLAITDAEARPEMIQRTELDRQQIAFTSGEYLPRWVTASPFSLAPSITTPATSAEATSRPTLTINAIAPFAYYLEITTESPTVVVFDRFFFPGWQATLYRISTETTPEGSLLQITAVPRPDGPLGLLAVDVPAGKYKLSLSYGGTSLALVVMPLSLTLIGVLVILLAWTRSRLVLYSFSIAFLLLSVGLISPKLQNSSPLVPLSVDYGNSIRLLGASFAETGQTDPTRPLPITLIWQSGGGIGSQLQVALRAIDDNGRVVGFRDKRPSSGLRPTIAWEPNQIVRDNSEISILPGEATGQYRLVVGLFDEASGLWVEPSGADSVTWTDPDGSQRRGALLGTVPLPTLSAASPPAYRNRSGAAFGGVIALRSYELSVGDAVASDSEVRVKTGDRLDLRIDWQALADPREDYAVFIHLLDRNARLISQDDEWPHRGFYPTSLWRKGEVVLDGYSLIVPESATSGVYELRLGLYRRSDGIRLPLTSGEQSGDSFSLGQVRLTATADSVQAAKIGPERTLPDYRLQGDPSGPIALRSYRLKDSARPGETISILLNWQSVGKPERDYSVFVHLYDQSGKLVAQTDGAPSDGQYPTSLWEPDEIVPDARSLVLPANLPPGSYHIGVGIYRAGSGERFRLGSGEDTLNLGEVKVGGS